MAIRIPDKFPRKLLVICLLIEIALVMLFFLTALFSEQGGLLYKLFNLDYEKNIPTLFSSLQLAAVGMVFFVMSRELTHDASLPISFDITVGAGFLFLSFDELLSVHERITSSLKHIDYLPRFEGDHGLWVAPYLALGILLLLILRKPVLHLLRTYRRESLIMLLGAILFVLGGVGLEVLSYELIRAHDYPWYVYALEVAMEEFLEMVGISIVLYGSLLLFKARSLDGGE
ncbi:hypothetical protein [Ferrimonas balearica]|uniref:hypothetical protein n=1 Tax=Ferrimonas balearica TaxID=44012 RepID=UPI001C96AAB2|nr:hypothetical protein [Ferrimonas balearica]MBY6223173.1 hypothetical protein [Ferrimonas balearica]